jgi:4-diphosphocytidyl-2-C-methyl-D-erythritol kinase
VITLLSPAKINRFLELVGIRPDGYHEIRTEMEAISLFDRLTLSKSDKTSLACSDSQLSTGQDNLVLKAHAVFEKRLQNPFSVSYHLEKKIPYQAGLGGGSGNAATALWGLNQLAGKPFNTQELMQMGEEIGSDIPFFFSCGRALCTGRGEIVQNLVPQLVPQQGETMTLVKPGFGLSTVDVYRAYKKLGGDGINHLERAAFFLSPELFDLKNALIQSGFSSVTLTGSGSALFCLGEGCCPKKVWSAKVKPISRSLDGWYL